MWFYSFLCKLLTWISLSSPSIPPFSFYLQMRIAWIVQRSAEYWVTLTAAGCPNSQLEETRQRVSTTATTCSCQQEWNPCLRQRTTRQSTPTARRRSVHLAKSGVTTPYWLPTWSPTWRRNVPSAHCSKRYPQRQAVLPRAAPACLLAPQSKAQLMGLKANLLLPPAPVTMGLLMVNTCHQPNKPGTRGSTHPCLPQTQWPRCSPRPAPGSAKRQQVKWSVSWSRWILKRTVTEWTLTRWWETSTNYCRTAEEVRPLAHSGSDIKDFRKKK